MLAVLGIKPRVTYVGKGCTTLMYASYLALVLYAGAVKLGNGINRKEHKYSSQTVAGSNATQTQR